MTNMKIGRMVMFALVATLFTGCYSVHVASSPDFSNCRIASEKDKIPTAHILVENDGWFLFDKIPLICGNANTASWFPWTFFKDEVSMEYVQKVIKRRAEQRGERIIQMNSINNNITLMQFPGTQGASIPYIICHHETQISAVYVKDPEKPEAEEEVEE